MPPNALTHPINCGVESNKSINLYSGDLEINQLQFNGSVSIEWFPSTTVCCKVSDQNTPQEISLILPDEYTFAVPSLSTKTSEYECHFRSGKYSNGVKNFSISVEDKYRSTVRAKDNVVYAKFHLPNFNIGSQLPIGKSIKYEDGSTYAGRIELNSDRFMVTIDHAFDTRRKFDQLKNSGGYLFTHVGKIQWMNNSLENVKDDLDIVAFYLWFITGRQTGPCLTATFDDNDCQIDQSWDLRSIDMYRPNSSWVVVTDPQCITAAFPEFVELCADPVKRKVIFDVIHWYVESRSESITINSSIVLLQTALEKVATLFLSEADFNSTNAPGKIEKLLDKCGIPNEIPEGTELKSQTVFQGFDSLSSAVTRIRNKTVHPTRTNQDALNRFESQAPNGVSEVYELSTWILQLALLKLFNFNGQYRNIVNYSNEDVPWL